MRRLLLFLMLMLGSVPLSAADLLVAVASNFRPTLERIAGAFETQTGHQVRLVAGSTGKHYAQIVHGAPFDLFLAADSERPLRLEQHGLVVAGTRFTYAQGALVLWSPRPELVDADGEVLRGESFRRLAIANPRLAPYGRAAMEVLDAMGLREKLQDRLVRGENIAQAFHFVRSGNADIGLLAHSQVLANSNETGGSLWVIPTTRYSPIRQQCVMLRDTAQGRRFMAFLRSPEALAIIRQFGYAAP